MLQVTGNPKAEQQVIFAAIERMQEASVLKPQEALLATLAARRYPGDISAEALLGVLWPERNPVEARATARVLKVRIRAACRRCSAPFQMVRGFGRPAGYRLEYRSGRHLNVGAVPQLDVDQRTLDEALAAAALTPMQERVIRALFDRQRRFVSAAEIADVIYADDRHGGPENASKIVAVFVWNIRRRLAAADTRLRLGSRTAVGYRLEVVQP
jgi:DNA-binding SARP family transcriptional activator